MTFRIRGCVSCALFAANAASAQTALEVRTEPRVELLSIVFHLSGAGVYNQDRLPSYSRDVDSTFAGFRDHAVVRRARTYEDSLGIGFDKPMEFAERLVDARTLRPIIPIDARAPEWWWPPGSAQPFLTDLRAFAHDAPVDRFFQAHATLYDTATARMRRLVDSSLDVAWFARFFGHKPTKPFVVVPGLLNGGANYGVQSRFPDGSLQFYAIIGAMKVDSAGWPVFDASYMPTIVHEFNHSFVNPVIDARRADFAAVGPAVLAAVQQQMKDMAYNDWTTVINESVVRVAVARYRMSHDGAAGGAAEVAEQRANGFLWMPALYALFGEYERDRARYPDLASFVPRLVEFWRALPPRLPALVAQYDSLRPRILATIPAAGDTAVDPSATMLTIRFDRPMRDQWMVNPLRQDSTARYPGTSGQIGFDAGHTVLTIPIRLDRGQSYALVLGRGFQSQDAGVPLARTVIRFRSR